MELIIRPFATKDYDTVIQLWREVNLPVKTRGRDSKEQVNEQIKNGTTVFLVAEIDQKLVGTVLGTHDGRKGWINRLAVNSNFRRQKIASTLINELEDRFVQMGLEVTACLIEEENVVSMEFFKELGYQEWSGKYFSKRKSPES